MTPCIFEDDPGVHDSLNVLIRDMVYEPVSTSDPEEALRLIRLGRCRLVFATVHLDTQDPYDFLSRALRCGPGIHVILITADYTLEAALEAIRLRRLRFSSETRRSSPLEAHARIILLQHPWPGNVRELENAISTACITATGDFIDLSDLPEHLQHRSLDEVRKAHIQKILQMCNGNRLRAAQILRIGRTSLYRYLKRDGFDARPRVHTTGAAALHRGKEILTLPTPARGHGKPENPLNV